MNTPTKAESIAKLAQWCVENSSKTFSAFFKWSPHVDGVAVSVHSDGWQENSTTSDDIESYIDAKNDAQVESWIGEAIDELNTLLAESNERNSPKNAARLQAKREANELARAKAVIARLESNE